jgi:hypothetical protein
MSRFLKNRPLVAWAALQVLVGISATSAAAQTVYHCVGFNRGSNTVVTRTIKIQGTIAETNRQSFAVEQVSGWYSLYGPIDPHHPQLDEKSPWLISLKISSGTYYVFDQKNDPNRALEWSRPQDQGCRQ